MKKILDVNQLRVGMYVVRVNKSSGNALMISKGLIKSEDSISRLRSLNIQEVEIDTALGNQEAAQKEARPFTPQKDDGISTSIKPSLLSNELHVAQRMYEKARAIQRSTFSKIRLEGTFEVSEYEKLAADFLDSIMRNQDALLCMTRLQDRDSYLLEHSINVGILLAIFAKKLGLSRDISLKLTLSGLLHDMGKVNIPDEILLKEGKLTTEEFTEMKKHSEYGAKLLTDSGIDSLAIQVALQHHERLSGNGYPQGLLAHQLNQYVRMCSIVDTYDAITAERVYKPAMTGFQAIKILKENGANQYDEKLVNQFINAIGLFYIGTTVQMTSGKLAIVTQTNYEDPLKPKLSIFYHTRFQRHIEIEILDLSSKKTSDSIEKVVNPADFGIDINAIIHRLILD